MTGSAINTDNRNIILGTPLAEAVNGAVVAADINSACFAIATDGAPVKGVVNYTTDGTVQRSNWTLIAGTNLLTVGETYYVSARGMIGLAGTRPIGVAISPTTLRVQIGQETSTPTAAQTAPQLIYGAGPPFPNVGVTGQIYVDTAFRNLYGPKTVNGVWMNLWTS